MANRKLPAFYDGWCSLCEAPWSKGEDLARWGGVYVHDYCAEASANRERINSGETYRSQAPSTYRRKAGRDNGR